MTVPSSRAIDEEWKAWVAVTLMPPTCMLPPFCTGIAFSTPWFWRYSKISKFETVAAPVCPWSGMTSEKWSKCPWVIRIVSSSPTRFRSSGVWGFSVRKGSMMICSSPAVTNRKVACPREVILGPPSISSTVYLHLLARHSIGTQTIYRIPARFFGKLEGERPREGTQPGPSAGKILFEPGAGPSRVGDIRDLGYLPIEDHGIVGDLHTAALVGTDGTIDWLCLPTFDSPSVFCSILDDERGGHFSLRPVEYVRSQQLYLPDTNVLLTRFLSPEGVAEILDFMPVHRDGRVRHRLVRNVRVIRGSVTFNAECRPAFDYARVAHSVSLAKGGAIFRGPQLALGLASPEVPLEVGEREAIRAR